MSSRIFSSVDDAELVERRRQQVVAAAAELYERNGFHKTTVKEIAQLAGVSAGLIYSYVKTKEDILYLVLVSLLESYAREIPQAVEGITDPVQRFCAAVRVYCRIVGANPGATQLAYRESKSLAIEQRDEIKQMELKTNALILACIEECVSAGYFRPVNVELAAYRIVLLAHGWALKAWRLRQFTTLDEYTEEGLELMLNALLSPAGWRHYSAGEVQGVQA